MATNWDDLISDIRRKSPQCPRAVIVIYLQRTLDEIMREYNITRDEVYVPFVDGTARYAFATTVLRIWDQELQYGTNECPRLTQKSIRDYEQSRYDHDRLRTEGIPLEIYLDPSSTGARMLGVFPVPNFDSISIASSTNATPSVVTTSAVHGLADGDAVFIAGHLTNTAINGQFYAKVTGYSTTTFAVYSDSDLATTVAGNGVGGATGYVGTSAAPFMRLYTSKSVTVADGATAIPESFDDHVDVLKAGVWKQWFENRPKDRNSYMEARAQYASGKQRLRVVTSGLLANVVPKSKPYFVRSSIVR
jgi:hypothetical protein